MIPLKDTIPSKTYPIVTIFLITVNFVVFIYESMLINNNILYFINAYGAIPKNFFILELFYPWEVKKVFLPLFTSMFLHGSLLHILSNMLYLWIFGDNVEDNFGHVKFLLFYILCGVIAAIAQIFINPYSQTPIIGASGAIAGVLGAYFILFPQSRVITLIPIIFFYRIIELPAILFLGIWFIIQFFSGTSSLSSENLTFGSGVAWWAHIGGFISGVTIAIISKKKIK